MGGFDAGPCARARRELLLGEERARHVRGRDDPGGDRERRQRLGGRRRRGTIGLRRRGPARVGRGRREERGALHRCGWGQTVEGVASVPWGVRAASRGARTSTFLGWSKIAPRSSGGDAHETAVFCARRWTQSVVLRDWRRLTGLLGAAKSLNCSKKPAPTYRQRTHYTTITTRSPRPPIHRLPPPRAAACRAQGQDSSRAVPATIAPRQKTPRPRP